MNLNKKTIVVIGAAGRLGSEIVVAMLNAGANVMAVDRSEKALKDLAFEHRQDSRFFPMEGDITQVESIKRIIELAVQKFGGIDGAVNTAYPRNANYGRQFFDVTYEDFCDNISLHLGGYFLFMQQCLKYSTEAGVSFSLVNMSSIYGVIAPRFEIYADTKMTMPVEYAAIKSSLQHLSSYVTAFSKGFDTEFRVNCVSPGGILDGQAQSFLDAYKRYSRSKGMLDAVDIIDTILFLLSDSSRYVCGQNIVIDDGFSS